MSIPDSLSSEFSRIVEPERIIVREVEDDRRKKGIMAGIERLKDAVLGEDQTMKRLRRSNESICTTAEDSKNWREDMKNGT